MKLRKLNSGDQFRHSSRRRRGVGSRSLAVFGAAMLAAACLSVARAQSPAKPGVSQPEPGTAPLSMWPTSREIKLFGTIQPKQQENRVPTPPKAEPPPGMEQAPATTPKIIADPAGKRFPALDGPFGIPNPTQ